MINNINYDINLLYKFSVEKYEECFINCFKKFIKYNRIDKRIDITFFVDESEFLNKCTREPGIYFNIYTFVDAKNLFNESYVNINKNNYCFRSLMSGFFNNDIKFSELFWRYNNRYDNIFNNKISKLNQFCIKNALPKLIKIYNKDYKRLKIS